MTMIRISIGYFSRIARLWIIWLFFALDLIGLVVVTVLPSYSVPRWVYIILPAIGFIAANIKLYAELQEEIQVLQRENEQAKNLSTFEYRRQTLAELYAHFKDLFSAFAEKEYANIFKYGNAYLGYFNKHRFVMDQETVRKLLSRNDRLKEIIRTFEQEQPKLIPKVRPLMSEEQFKDWQESKEKRRIELAEMSEAGTKICQEIDTLLESIIREELPV